MQKKFALKGVINRGIHQGDIYLLFFFPIQWWCLALNSEILLEVGYSGSSLYVIYLVIFNFGWIF